MGNFAKQLKRLCNLKRKASRLEKKIEKKADELLFFQSALDNIANQIIDLQVDLLENDEENIENIPPDQLDNTEN